MKIVTSEQMRRIEQECAKSGTSLDTLMENAGKAVAEEVRRFLGTIENQQIVCLIGPGNNGGDGLVAARHLHDWGAGVSVYLCAPRPPQDPNLALVKKRGITVLEAAGDAEIKALDSLLANSTAVIDAVFGTGKVRPFSGLLPQILTKVANTAKTGKLRVIAVDLPSGLNADTGEIDPASLYADCTVTLGFPKPGLFAFPGAERVGKLVIADIGIPASLAEGATTELLTSEWARSVLPRRPLDANKGTFGKVLVAAGSINYIGAAYLVCSGALRAGAGLVTLATAGSLVPILAGKLNEVTYLPLPEAQPGIISTASAGIIAGRLSEYNVLAVGCGIGQSRPAMEAINAILANPALPATIIDADGLNTLAKTPDWWQRLTKDAILTPHPGEMSRLCGKSIEEVQKDRTGTAERAAGEWHKTVVLKGAFAIIAAPDGRTRVSPTANPGLATAGTGDVLTGVIAGLAAQGLSLFDAAALGVYLHGEAGETVKAALGDTGMTASDLLPALPQVIKRLRTSTGG